MISADKTPTEAKLLVWWHLQLITQASRCFQNHLTLTSRTEDKPLGQSGLIRTHPFLPRWWPAHLPCYPGPLACEFSTNPHHHTIRRILLLDPSYGEGNRFKEVGYSSLVCRVDRVKLAGILTHVFGPGQRTCRIKSFSKLHIYSRPERPGASLILRAKANRPCKPRTLNTAQYPILTGHQVGLSMCFASVITCPAQAWHQAGTGCL